MNKILNCYAQSCINNMNYKCELNNISIGNPSSLTTAETRCKMFEKVENKEIKSSVESDYYNEVEIHCTATKCKHNNMRKCKAKEIHINPAIASCDTFVI